MEAKNAEMERFVYTISNDLRSPLVTVQGFAGFLREDVSAEDQVKVETDLHLPEEVRSRGIKVILGDDWPVVRADRLRVLEVLNNLIENSTKYAGDEVDPEIEIGWRREDGETTFFVRDNGIGIEPGQNLRWARAPASSSPFPRQGLNLEFSAPAGLHLAEMLKAVPPAPLSQVLFPLAKVSLYNLRKLLHALCVLHHVIHGTGLERLDRDLL